MVYNLNFAGGLTLVKLFSPGVFHLFDEVLDQNLRNNNVRQLLKPELAYVEVKHWSTGFVCFVESIGQELFDRPFLLNSAVKDKVNLVFHPPVHIALKIL